MRKKFLTAAAAAAALAVTAVGTAGAITDGELDEDGHPFVGIMIAQDGEGEPLWRCSGTLISENLFLTAGHCTESPTEHVEIWFDTDVDKFRVDPPAGSDDDPIWTNGYPYEGAVGGTPYVHPDYNPDAFFLYDLGMVVLDDPMPMSEYGELPEENQLDRLKTRRGKQDVTFRAVGYGLQQINPVFVQSDRVRMVAYPKLNQINTPGFTGDFSLLLSNNHSTGGTCFGDSGGPNFLGDSNVIAGVTSFGINGNCAGTGGVYRIDRADDLDWIYETFGGLL